MATRPADSPNWADDPNAQITDPGNTKQSEGWAEAEKPSAHHMNWIQNLHGKWIDYLSEKASLRNVQVFTADGTWNKPSWCEAVRVIVVGGGGGGGGVQGTSGSGEAAASGGGGGGMAVEYITSPGSSETVTVGVGGSGGTGSGTNGVPGSDSSFGSHATGGGGSAGLGLTTRTTGTLRAPGGSGGSASGGDYNVEGNPGGARAIISGEHVMSGFGGASALGGGATDVSVTGAGINAPANSGGGGSGATATSSDDYAGGDGADGIVIVEEYDLTS
jgi:hypothetical protein